MQNWWFYYNYCSVAQQVKQRKMSII